MKSTITINGKEYVIKYTIRAMFIWEQIMKKPFNPQTLLDNYAFFYSIILANNPDDPPTWDEFIDALDTDPQLVRSITAIVDRTLSQNAMFGDGDNDEGNKSKKK